MYFASFDAELALDGPTTTDDFYVLIKIVGDFFDPLTRPGNISITRVWFHRIDLSSSDVFIRADARV